MKEMVVQRTLVFWPQQRCLGCWGVVVLAETDVAELQLGQRLFFTCTGHSHSGRHSPQAQPPANAQRCVSSTPKSGSDADDAESNITWRLSRAHASCGECCALSVFVLFTVLYIHMYLPVTTCYQTLQATNFHRPWLTPDPVVPTSPSPPNIRQVTAEGWERRAYES